MATCCISAITQSASIATRRNVLKMVCPCLYPLIIVDKRYGDDIEYISIPSEVFEDMGEIECPEFEEVEEEGFDGEIHEYMAVMWKDPSNAFTKKYDVNEHIVIAGCDAKIEGEGENQKIKCKRKELYLVLHPIKEWKEYHKIKVK